MIVLYMYDPALDEYLYVRYGHMDHAIMQYKLIKELYPPMRMFVITD